MLHSFSVGNVLKNGIAVAIVGKPNAGKSTLLNALLNEERAIVSDIAGTTRDTIEETLHIGGISFRFIDTAGIREAKDQIEAIGVQKAKEKMALAHILLYLYDENDNKPDEIISFIKENYRKDLKIILLHNKIDQYEATYSDSLSNFDATLKAALMPEYTTTLLGISARDHQNLDLLTKELTAYANTLVVGNNAAIVTNLRHYEALKEALQAIEKVKEGLALNLSGDLLAIDLREALYHLGSITGTVTNDEVLGHIFSKFCIGK